MHCNPHAEAALPPQYHLSPHQPLLQPPCSGSLCLDPHHTRQLVPPGYDALDSHSQPRLSSMLGFHPGPTRLPSPSPRLVLWGRAKQRSGDSGIWASLYFNKIVCSSSYIYTWGRQGIYMTQWGYIQGSGRLGKGRTAALEPALADGSVPAGAPVSDPRRGPGRWGGDRGVTASQVLKRDGKVPCGAARPRKRLRAS